jgi:hypothetical protein
MQYFDLTEWRIALIGVNCTAVNFNRRFHFETAKVSPQETPPQPENMSTASNLYLIHASLAFDVQRGDGFRPVGVLICGGVSVFLKAWYF